MAGGIDWFRWHHGSVTDPKFQLVARRAGASLPDVLAVWAYILETASAAGERGHIGDLDAEALDCLFGFPSTETRTAGILMAMSDRKLIVAGTVAKWDARQPKREREDNSTDRVRAFRAKQGNETPWNASETPCNAKESVETPRGEERREELTPPDGGVSGATRAPTTRGTRLPNPWALPKSWGDWSQREYPHWSVEAVRLIAADFADHWHGKSGKDATKVDWEATWRKWCRSDITQRSHPHPGAASETTYQRSMRERMELVAPSIAAKRPGAPTPANPMEILDGLTRIAG